MASSEMNQVIHYMIDADDRNAYVSEGWWFFAEENGAGPDCHPPRLLGRSLWNFIAGEETRHLDGIMVAKVRSDKQSVQVPIRCDSPELRRKIIIVLKFVADGHIEFICRTTHIEARPPVDLLRQEAHRGNHILRVCRFCKKIAVPSDEWIDIERAIERLELFAHKHLPQLSHGVCPTCRAAALAGL